MNWPQPQLAHDPAEWLGDAHPLVEQLGQADGLASLQDVSLALRTRPVASLGALREFLLVYRERVLLPHEMPAIRTAYEHASRNELRELIAFDQILAARLVVREFGSASRRVGRGQLQKLRPLRDERLVQRYLAAVERNEANGWHTLVFGLTLMVYSLPLRQGLLGYAHQTLRGFIQSAAQGIAATDAECRELFEEVCEPLGEAVEELLAAT